METDKRAHWDKVYSTKADTEVSWFEEMPTLSMELIRQATASHGAAIDVGGGASRLVDALLDEGFAEVSVLDMVTSDRIH